MQTASDEQLSVLTDLATESMKAVRIHRFGDSSVLSYEDAMIPVVGPDEVLIKVHSTAVNPVDWKIREGHGRNEYVHTFPITLGWDVSGTLERVGNLITGFKKGDQVIARPDPSRNGAYAEYVAVKGFELALAPNVISLQKSAGIPLAAQTAWVGLFEIGVLKQDQTVLIHGGSGGVGSFAVQLAKIAGAQVIATTSTRNKQLVSSLGADEVVDYTMEDFQKIVHNVDLVFDTIGGETQSKSWSVLRKNGKLVSPVGVDENAAKRAGALGESYKMTSNGSRLTEIVHLVNKGMLHVLIDSEFALSEARAAHDHSESGRAKGKIILRVQ